MIYLIDFRKERNCNLQKTYEILDYENKKITILGYVEK